LPLQQRRCAAAGADITAATNNLVCKPNCSAVHAGRNRNREGAQRPVPTQKLPSTTLFVLHTSVKRDCKTSRNAEHAGGLCNRQGSAAVQLTAIRFAHLQYRV
jgi:hypothetical protein